MPKLRLTKTAIDALVAGPVDAVYWDDSLTGFGVKVTPKGRKVFIVLYRTKNGAARLRKYTIGTYGSTTVATARVAAQKVLAARAEGRDLAGERREARRRSVVDRIEVIAEEYLKRHAANQRSVKETRRLLEKEVLAKWSGRSIHDIRKRDVIELMDAIVDRGASGTANNTYTALRALMNWCVRRSVLEVSPCAGLPEPVRKQSRDRVLTDAELASVLSAARQIGFPYGQTLEMLCLTGQRRSEVAETVWDEIDLSKSVWTIPGARAKNRRPHLVHLAPAALRIIEGIPRRGNLVFSYSGSTPFSNWTEAKRKLDKIAGVSDWVLHDLRRTVVSGMARLGIAPHVSDKILNHQSGSISGIAAIYQRHEFLKERHLALQVWADHVGDVIAQSHRLVVEPQQVVPGQAESADRWL